ncbi:HAD family phosphatase [Actinotalea sp. M2MS4P-6]|uniref:HAD family hydrolase n=1 Tax=Actinotalea sp. M2MS4P-6 TaxID=2983762 RepID=UPI0021E3E678|nr:HAD family phosphatase [Actinotalea sp. M2MS4P-6]MCV2392947.1 HAD family phosphatase [Actinotalea sp. M2MS4P-6]
MSATRSLALDVGWPAGTAEVDAVLVDLDGTLLDTEPVWSAVAHALADRLGATWSDEDDLRIVGWSVPAVATLLRERGVPWGEARVVDALHDAVAERLAASGVVPWREGARELLTAARAAGLPTGLVTMSHRRLTRAAADRFDVVVAGDEVSRPKPDPQAYLVAAAMLGVDPSRCLVVEDSPTGVGAGLAAGAWVAAVDPAQDVSGVAARIGGGAVERLVEVWLPVLAAHLDAGAPDRVA